MILLNVNGIEINCNVFDSYNRAFSHENKEELLIKVEAPYIPMAHSKNPSSRTHWEKYIVKECKHWHTVSSVINFTWNSNYSLTSGVFWMFLVNETICLYLHSMTMFAQMSQWVAVDITKRIETNENRIQELDISIIWYNAKFPTSPVMSREKAWINNATLFFDNKLILLIE